MCILHKDQKFQPQVMKPTIFKVWFQRKSWAVTEYMSVSSSYSQPGQNGMSAIFILKKVLTLLHGISLARQVYIGRVRWLEGPVYQRLAVFFAKESATWFPFEFPCPLIQLWVITFSWIASVRHWCHLIISLEVIHGLSNNIAGQQHIDAYFPIYNIPVG